MQTNIPDDVPEYYAPEEMNNVIRNLGEAGWLKGSQFVDQK
jgi:hypothetical protein